MRKPWERAVERMEGAGVVDGLAALPASALTALLLEVNARRSAGLDAADVRRQYEADAFVQPAPLDQREVLAFDAHLLSRVPLGFEALELSPLAPAGACSALGPVHPNNVVATHRGTEVLADSTNVLALECARRRGLEGAGVVKLCTSHRLVRAQRVAQPGFAQHFRILTLVTAGRDAGGRRFEEDAVVEHLEVWLGVLADLPAGYRAEVIGVSLAFDETHREVAARVRERVRAKHDVPFTEDGERLQKSGYYRGLAFRFDVRNAAGMVLPLGDGGLVDWVAKLRADRKERTLISAIGSELVMKLCRAP